MSVLMFSSPLMKRERTLTIETSLVQRSQERLYGVEVNPTSWPQSAKEMRDLDRNHDIEISNQEVDPLLEVTRNDQKYVLDVSLTFEEAPGRKREIDA